MVALFVVPAFCTKSGYIYKNKGGGATKSEPNQKRTAIVKYKESDTGANYTFRIKNGQQTFCQDGRFVRKTFCQDCLRRFVRKTFCQDHICDISFRRTGFDVLSGPPFG